MSYSTLGWMVTDAVKGTPTTAPTKNAHFRSRCRVQTPARGDFGDSNATESDSDTNAETGIESYDDAGDSSFLEESDSATKMALIRESFKQTPKVNQFSTSSIAPSPGQHAVGVETSKFSSQDATLLELQERAKETNDQGPSKTKKPKRERRAPQRGTPMREEIFAKIGWTRSFISGPADPVHNPLIV